MFRHLVLILLYYSTTMSLLYKWKRNFWCSFILCLFVKYHLELYTLNACMFNILSSLCCIALCIHIPIRPFDVLKESHVQYLPNTKAKRYTLIIIKNIPIHIICFCFFMKISYYNIVLWLCDEYKLLEWCFNIISFFFFIN